MPGAMSALCISRRAEHLPCTLAKCRIENPVIACRSRTPLLTRLGSCVREPFQDDQRPVVIGPLGSAEDFSAKSGHISWPPR